MKKTLSIILAILMIVTTVPMAFAADDYAVVDTEAGTVTIDGTLGGKTTATEDDVNALVEKLKGYVDSGITTIIVTGSEPALHNFYDIDTPAVSAALYYLADNNYDSPYCGTIDLILPDVTEIVDDEFNNTFALNSITLPKVTKLGDLAFYACCFIQTIAFGSVVTDVEEGGGVMFAVVGQEVGGCDLILNCGQMNSSYIPDLDTNTWKFRYENEFKSITLTHTGGEATCIAKAVCETCGEEYGEFDANKHTLVQKDAKAPTCTEIGWDAYESCTECDYTTYEVLPADPDAHDYTNHYCKRCGKAEDGYYAAGACGANGDNLNWSLDSDGVLTISGEGEMQEMFIYLDQPWKDYRRDIKEVVIEEGVTKIAEAAFYLLTNLEKVTISSTAEFEDFSYCFIACSSLKDFIVSPANPYYCTDEYGVVFSKDKSKLIKAFDLSDVDYVIPDTVTSVAEEAFDGIKIKSIIVNIALESMFSDAEIGKLIVDCANVEAFAFAFTTIGEVVLTNKVSFIGYSAFGGAVITSAHYLGDPANLTIDANENESLTDVLHYCEHKEGLAPTCTEIGWDAYEYCTACTYTTYVEKEALNHKDDDNDSLCDYECGTELVVLDGEMFVVNGDVTNTGIYIGPFDAFNDCYKAGDGYITIIGEGNNDTVMTLYDATIDVRGTETTNAIRISGEDVEIRFFGENNIFADEEAISNAIGSVDHGNIFIGEENAVLNLYGNISACEVTVESGTINIYGSDEKGEIVAVYIEKQFVVSENAVVNIISGDSGIGLNVGILAQKGIIAEGELNAITLNGTETDDEIIYNLIAIGDAVLGADTYSPYYGMEIPEDMNVEVNFIVPEGASVTVPKGITLNLDSMTNVDIDGELIVYGTLICTHTGGENTCDAPAVCDICGTEYGNIDADNHKDTLVQVDAKAPTCTEIGWDAYEYCTACNYTTYVEKEALTHSFTKYEVTEEAKCGVEGKEVAACDNGCGATDEKAIDALTHKDADGDYKCDNGCGHEFEKPAPEEPTPDTPDEPTDNCDHLCHKGGFMGFIWKIVQFFWKLFKMNPVCECGAAHY